MREHADRPDQAPPEPVPIDPASQAAAEALMRAMHLQRRLLQKLLADAGSPESHPGQAVCLRVLAVNDGIAQRDLAETLHVSRPTVTAMLQRMEHGGFIERRVDPCDQRISRVYLTEVGRAREREMHTVFAEYVGRTFARMPEPERRDLERLLRALCEHVDSALHDAPSADADASERAASEIPSSDAEGTSRR